MGPEDNDIRTDKVINNLHERFARNFFNFRLVSEVESVFFSPMALRINRPRHPFCKRLKICRVVYTKKFIFFIFYKKKIYEKLNFVVEALLEKKNHCSSFIKDSFECVE